MLSTWQFKNAHKKKKNRNMKQFLSLTRQSWNVEQLISAWPRGWRELWDLSFDILSWRRMRERNASVGKNWWMSLGVSSFPKTCCLGNQDMACGVQMMNESHIGVTGSPSISIMKQPLSSYTEDTVFGVIKVSGNWRTQEHVKLPLSVQSARTWKPERQKIKRPGKR